MPRSKMVDVQTRTRTDVSTGLLMATIAICGVVMLGSFGTSMAAGITQIASPTKLSIYATDGAGSRINSGGTLKAPPFNFTASVVNTKAKNLIFVWQLYKDNKIFDTVTDAQGRVVSVIMNDTLKPGKYTYKVTVNSNNLNLASQNFNFNVANNIICTDSDMDSNTGKTDFYMKGSTSGLLNGVYTTVEDSCKGAVLTEYSCGGGIGQISTSGVTCDNGCVQGACQRCVNSSIDDVSFSVQPCNEKVPFNDGLGNKTFDLYIIASKNVPFEYRVEIVNKSLPREAITMANGSGKANGKLTLIGNLIDKHINTANILNADVQFKVTINYNRKKIIMMYDFPLVVYPAMVCSETDKGNDINKKGITTGPEPKTGRAVQKIDYCNGAKVSEYFCLKEAGSKNTIASFVSLESFSCPKGSSCFDGACAKNVPTTTKPIQATSTSIIPK